MQATTEINKQGRVQEDDLFGAWEPASPIQANTPRKKNWLYGGGMLAAAVMAVAGVSYFTKPAAPTFSAVAVERGDIRRTISATGKVQAVTTVQVGSQVSGIVAELYADFNQRVKAGQLVAKLDPSQLQAQLTQVQASAASARARVQTAQTNVLSAKASVDAAQANLSRAESVAQDAERNYELTKSLLAEGAASKRQVETAQAALAQAAAQRVQAVAQVNQAKAQAQASESQLAQAQAEAQQANASVEVAQVNLSRTSIVSPIDGVVVARNVDVGQTVAASLQAPTLFLIANDLTKMQVLAEIDEADVGQLTSESRVNFTVDAYPNETFRGSIAQIRLAPQTVQNVVTYTAVVNVDNPDLKLKPGMTASITAVVAEARNVLKIPNAALRFKPETAAAPSTATAAPRKRPEGAARRQGAEIYRVTPEGPKPVRVRLGLTDGVTTEIVTDDLKEGDQVAVPALQAQTNTKQGSAARSPFTPSGPRGGGKR